MYSKQALIKMLYIFMALVCFISKSFASVENQNAITLAKQNACLGCHAVDKKIVGPSFQSVAQKYQSDQNAKTFLKNKIAKGGAGSWGVVPMPANAKLNDAQLNALVDWVLRGAPN